jgi:hypothetical protein
MLSNPEPYNLATSHPCNLAKSESKYKSLIFSHLQAFFTGAFLFNGGLTGLDLYSAPTRLLGRRSGRNSSR